MKMAGVDRLVGRGHRLFLQKQDGVIHPTGMRRLSYLLLLVTTLSKLQVFEMVLGFREDPLGVL